ncbi:MAG: HupE/UreJ family protein [Methylotenera sp.]|nr:HupE/UreJ family protein [Oligoflexia bacterium]
MMSFLLFPAGARAHPLDIALLTLNQKDSAKGSRFEAKLEMNPTVVATLLKVNSADLPQALQLRTPELFRATLGENPMKMGLSNCVWAEPPPGIIESSQTLSITAAANCPAGEGELSMSLPFLKRMPSTFSLMYMVKLEALEKMGTLEHPSSELSLRMSQPSRTFLSFVSMGVKHIGAFPSEWAGDRGLHFPDGIDHILFVVALVIGGSGIISILKTVTGFTLGHSVTLALATFGLIHVPARLVESAIALSIAFVAAESIFASNTKSRWKLALFFGLVHGLGFASALAELHLDRASIAKALIGFNAGVEVGQGIIVALVLPWVFTLRKFEITRKFAIPAASVAIFALGSFWFVTRAFGMS